MACWEAASASRMPCCHEPLLANPRQRRVVVRRRPQQPSGESCPSNAINQNPDPSHLDPQHQDADRTIQWSSEPQQRHQTVVTPAYGTCVWGSRAFLLSRYTLHSSYPILEICD
ncbi:hypothetical protein GWK47_032287 [Chionoecetes opilio]|uniref:Uncharacterized protein n=1 Tax=Chionoecetes opilio TaxID=41210 RepID=A0A8J5D3W4_CHIOP|nr:hypothetical protein GWK47_032287 [Chionoecetes opilio]